MLNTHTPQPHPSCWALSAVSRLQRAGAFDVNQSAQYSAPWNGSQLLTINQLHCSALLCSVCISPSQQHQTVNILVIRPTMLLWCTLYFMSTTPAAYCTAVIRWIEYMHSHSWCQFSSSGGVCANLSNLVPRCDSQGTYISCTFFCIAWTGRSFANPIYVHVGTRLNNINTSLFNPVQCNCRLLSSATVRRPKTRK